MILNDTCFLFRTEGLRLYSFSSVTKHLISPNNFSIFSLETSYLVRAMKNIIRYPHYKLLFVTLLAVLFIQCHTTKWARLQNPGPAEKAPEKITAIFNQYPNQIMVLEATTPGFNYKYDIGEKDPSYGQNDSIFRFHKVSLKLHDKMPQGKIFVDFIFEDSKQNKIRIDKVDILRLTPKFDAIGDMVLPEIIEEEFNRFGYVFRKEHQEFSIDLNNNASPELKNIKNRAYRCKIVNNCLAATKWEFELTSADFSDYKGRLKNKRNLNQNKVLSHSWFYLNKELYAALIQLKNSGKDIPYDMEYNKLSDLAEQVTIVFSSLRSPIVRRLATEVIEIGHKSGRKIEPLDNELYYKKQFNLFLEGDNSNYTSILQKPVKTTQFKDAGFYTAATPKEFSLEWMQYVDDVHLDVLKVKGTEAYVEITLTGKWAPYKISIGNVDLAQIEEQKLYGMLFGFNTYPKSRRYNPKQSTLAYDAALLPDALKPYVLLTQKDTNKWVNNQYKGIEKIYLTYETLERDVLQIYVLSYERITPVWMASVKLPKEIREKIRIRKQLYSY